MQGSFIIGYILGPIIFNNYKIYVNAYTFYKYQKTIIIDFKINNPNY